jgi:hypothetical protein
LHFPITKTVDINYPEGISIVYTDSNPLLSIIAKLSKAVFPPSFQFTGIWYLICWILQSVFGFLVVRKLTKNQVYALLAGFLLCLLPTQIFRVSHENLMAFWLILWSIFIYIHDKYSIQKKQLLFFIVLCIAALVHGYFVFMVFFVTLVWLTMVSLQLFKEKEQRFILKFIVINSAYTLGFILLLWVTGYFYNSPRETDLAGFGFFSMNLNSPFNPMDPVYSNFLPPIKINNGQYEGFQYFGLGILLLLFVVGLFYLKKISFSVERLEIFGLITIAVLLVKGDSFILYERLLFVWFFLTYFLIIYFLYRGNQFRLMQLYIVATICSFLAFSNIWTLGKTELFTIEIPGFLNIIFAKMRSSGRFFWIATHIIVISGSLLLYKAVNSKKVANAILSVIVVVQILDITKLEYRVDSNNTEYQSPLPLSSVNMIKAASVLHFMDEVNLRVAECAINNKVKINNFYLAHGQGPLTQEKLARVSANLNRKKFEKRSLYLSKSLGLPLNTKIKAYPFGFNDYLAFHSEDIKLAENLDYFTLEKKNYDSISTVLDIIKTNPVVIMVAQDEASNSLSFSFREKYDKVFNGNLKKLAFRNSYLAIFNNGKLIFEELSPDHSIEFKGEVSGQSVYAKSAGFDHGNTSSIIINGTEFSTKQTGLNIAVVADIDGKRNASYIVTNFNTYSVNYP